VAEVGQESICGSIVLPIEVDCRQYQHETYQRHKPAAKSLHLLRISGPGKTLAQKDHCRHTGKNQQQNESEITQRYSL